MYFKGLCLFVLLNQTIYLGLNYLSPVNRQYYHNKTLQVLQK